jgi:hypothetical protein
MRENGLCIQSSLLELSTGSIFLALGQTEIIERQRGERKELTKSSLRNNIDSLVQLSDNTKEDRSESLSSIRVDLVPSYDLPRCKFGGGGIPPLLFDP